MNTLICPHGEIDADFCHYCNLKMSQNIENGLPENYGFQIKFVS